MKPKRIWTFDAVVLAWHDGDTLTCAIDVGFNLTLKEPLRLAGVDTPELNSPNPGLRVRARLARDRAAEACPVGTPISVTTEKGDSRDKYGRWLGTVYCDVGGQPTCLNALLISEGHGVPYDGGKRG